MSNLADLRASDWEQCSPKLGALEWIEHRNLGAIRVYVPTRVMLGRLLAQKAKKVGR